MHSPEIHLVDVVGDVEHGLVGLLDEVVLLVRRRRVRHQLAQDQVVLQDALHFGDHKVIYYTYIYTQYVL